MSSSTVSVEIGFTSEHLIILPSYCKPGFDLCERSYLGDGETGFAGFGTLDKKRDFSQFPPNHLHKAGFVAFRRGFRYLDVP
jgi:hypothetical protein